jgi:hypothetical protein
VKVRWTRRGLLYAPSGEKPWARSHASLPVALPLHGTVCRVYFAARDEHQRSSVGWVEADLATGEVLREADEPVLAPGPLGCFDDHGVYPASIVAHGGELRMYYIGWNPGARPPLFYATIGLAVSDDGGLTFRKAFRAPILARGEHDPCLVTSPFVMEDAGRWRMWYVSGFRWEDTPEGLQSYYHVKYAESDDGVAWRREGKVAIELRPGERNIARPCVRREGGTYRMWYSANWGEGYRIGYAESADGVEWTRQDGEAGIAPAGEGWDGEALAYPWVGTVGGTRWMLYNGNGFGRTGFGLAAGERDA